jgi:cold shock CspA family protein
MPVGRLKMWNSERGFGFVTDDSSGGVDMFVHVRQMEKAGIYDPRVGDALEYAVGVFNGKDEAVSIARIERVGE